MDPIKEAMIRAEDNGDIKPTRKLWQRICLAWQGDTEPCLTSCLHCHRIADELSFNHTNGEEDAAFVRSALSEDIAMLERENERLRAALEVCAADWISAPGTVMGAAQGLSAEFRRRMEAAHAALQFAR